MWKREWLRYSEWLLCGQDISTCCAWKELCSCFCCKIRLGKELWGVVKWCGLISSLKNCCMQVLHLWLWPSCKKLLGHVSKLFLFHWVFCWSDAHWHQGGGIGHPSPSLGPWICRPSFPPVLCPHSSTLVRSCLLWFDCRMELMLLENCIYKAFLEWCVPDSLELHFVIGMTLCAMVSRQCSGQQVWLCCFF